MNTKELISPWVIGGAIISALGFLGGLLLILSGIPASSSNVGEGAVLTVIPAPTSTPTPLVPEEEPTPTISLAGTIQTGAYVQITGTGGDGLRLRHQPSLNAEIDYLGLEEETFIVIDGPNSADGFVWWYLESPTDQTRKGWAVSDYLEAVVGQ